MAAKFYQDPNFIKLQKEWYSKLNHLTGFKDIEVYKPITGGELFGFMPRKTNELCHLYNAESAEYFRMAQNFLTHYQFETLNDQIVWSLHCDGLSYREIAQRLKQLSIKMSYYPVHIIINRLKKVAIEFNYLNPEGLYFIEEEEVA